MDIIETPRLLLRPFEVADEPFVVATLMDEDFMVFSPSGAVDITTAKQRFQSLLRQSVQSGFAKLAVVLKRNQQLIGYCGVASCELEGKPEIELGYRLIKSARGFGYATEAASAVLEECARKGVKNIVAFTEPQNHPSINVLQKLGFSFSSNSRYQNMPIVIFRR